MTRIGAHVMVSCLTMMVIRITQFSHELSLVTNNVNQFPLELVASAVQQCACLSGGTAPRALCWQPGNNDDWLASQLSRWQISPLVSGGPWTSARFSRTGNNFVFRRRGLSRTGTRWLVNTRPRPNLQLPPSLRTKMHNHSSQRHIYATFDECRSTCLTTVQQTYN